MNSMPAASAICARARQSGQLPDQRSGTRVTARPEEQFAPKRPSLSLFALPIAARRELPMSRSIIINDLIPRPLSTVAARPAMTNDRHLLPYQPEGTADARHPARVEPR